MSLKGANSPTRGRKLRSTGTKARARVSNGPNSLIELKKQLEARTRELAEALEQRAATSEVLRIIASSPGELEPVFETMLANAARLCEAKFGTLYLCEGDALRSVAAHNVPPAFGEFRRRGPFRPVPGGLLHEVLRTKRTGHVADVRATRAYAERNPTVVTAVELGGVRASVAVPMLKDDELIGLISIYRQEVRPFTETQIELVQNFANQAVIAIENTRLLNELRESLQQQTATSDVLRIISSSPGDLEPVFQTMLENATRLCEAKFGTLNLYEGDVFHQVGFYNVPPAYAEARGKPMRPHPRSGPCRGRPDEAGGAH